MAVPLLVAAALPAQEVWGTEWEVHREHHPVLNGYDNVGWSVASAGDVDGDGVPDQVIGSPLGPYNGTNGRVYLFSGADASLLLEFAGPADATGFGMAVAGPGDMDGDGVPDIAVGAPLAPHGGGAMGSIFLYSGASGALLQRLDGDGQLGSALTGPGDVDGDGGADLLAGAPLATGTAGRRGAGWLTLYSGRTGSILLEVPGQVDDGQLGRAVAPIGDVDGDGTPDLLAAAYAYEGPGSPGAHVFSGRTGQVLTHAHGPPDAGAGWSLAAAGDMDGDGIQDILVGAPSASPNGVVGAGTVTLHSGASGRILVEFQGLEAYASFGRHVAGGSDLDGDGRLDVAVGAPLGRQPSVHVFSARTGVEPIILGWDLGVYHSSALAVAGDVNGDGHGDLLLGARNVVPPGGSQTTGLAQVVGLWPTLAPRTAALSQSGGGTVNVSLHLQPSFAWHRYQLLASAAGVGSTWIGGVEVPLVADALLRRTLAGSYPPWALGMTGVLDGGGRAAAALAPPPGALDPVLVGRTLALAVLVAPPAGRPVFATPPSLLAIEP